MIPYISKQQMEKIDDLMIKKYKITVTKMMEYAGYNTAILAKKLSKGPFLIVCGKGNNSGDGLCAARHLHNFGFKVKIFLITKNLKDEPLYQLNILKKLNIEIFTSINKLKSEINNSRFIIDALLGYNIKGNPKGKFKEAIDIINNSKKQTLSIDIPSGYHIDSQKPLNPTVKAQHTITLSLPKSGTNKVTKNLYLSDMSVPNELLKELNIKAKDIFKKEQTIRIK